MEVKEKAQKRLDRMNLMVQLTVRVLATGRPAPGSCMRPGSSWEMAAGFSVLIMLLPFYFIAFAVDFGMRILGLWAANSGKSGWSSGMSHTGSESGAIYPLPVACLLSEGHACIIHDAVASSE